MYVPYVYVCAYTRVWARACSIRLLEYANTYWSDVYLEMNFSHLRPAALSPAQFDALSLRCGRVLTDVSDVSSTSYQEYNSWSYLYACV